MSGIAIRGIGAALPGDNGIRGHIADGKDILKRLLGFSWYLTGRKKLSRYKGAVANLENKTGIRTRNHIDSSVRYPNTYLATASGLETLKNSGDIDPQKIEGLIFATDTPDFVYPSPGIIVAKILGIKPKRFANCSMACASIADALQRACTWLDKGLCNNVLVLSGDVTTRLKLGKNRLEPFIFGDAFVGMYLERAKQTEKGGFVFSDVLLDPELSDLFVHRHFYSTDSLTEMYSQDNDTGLDLMGDIDAAEMSLQLQDWLKNSGDKITKDTKIILPQVSKKSIDAGVANFRNDTGIDISPNLVENSAYEHGNTGAAAVPLALMKGIEIAPEASFLVSIVGVGGIKTTFKRDPNTRMAYDFISIDERKERPDYRAIVDERAQDLAKCTKSRSRKKMKTNGLSSLNRFNQAGNNGDMDIKLSPIMPARRVGNAERVYKSVATMLRLI